MVQQQERKGKILNTSVELTRPLSRRIRIACAILGESQSKFLRVSAEERLTRLDLPELKLLEGTDYDHQATT